MYSEFSPWHMQLSSIKIQAKGDPLMTIKSSPKSARERRQAQRRNQRLILIVIAVAILAMVAVFAYTYFFRDETTSSGNPAALDPDIGVVTLDSGLQYQDLVLGQGSPAKAGDTAVVHYTGWLTDGTKFDSSLDRGAPFTFTLGRGSVIQGWDIGVAGMQPGGKRKLVIPPELAYGDRSVGSFITPGSTLVFEVELIEIQSP